MLSFYDYSTIYIVKFKNDYICLFSYARLHPDMIRQEPLGSKFFRVPNRLIRSFLD